MQAKDKPFVATQTDQLPHALNGRRQSIESAAGLLSYYAGHVRQGVPLLLVHSVNAAASAAEVRPLFEHYASRRPVYALDLPGFGRSERSDRDYTPRLMTDAVLAMRDLIAQAHGGQPIDGMAVSLGCEFLARAATESRGAFRSLALVSPTGLAGGSIHFGQPASSRDLPWLHRLLRGTRLGPALFRQLVRPRVIRYFLQRSFGSDRIDETLHAYCVLSAHQQDAEHAPLAFLSRQPFAADITAVYDDLTEPVWLARGVRGRPTDFGGAELLVASGRWRESVFDSGSMPYFDQPGDFISRYETFLEISSITSGAYSGSTMGKGSKAPTFDFLRSTP